MPRKMGREYVTSFSLAKTVQLSPGLLSTGLVDISPAQASQFAYFQMDKYKLSLYVKC